MKYVVDIDGTICRTKGSDYENSEPIQVRINHFNMLYDWGNEIHYWTARGGNSGKDWRELTERQLKEWGCRYTSLKTGKPPYDWWIDDKAMNADLYFAGPHREVNQDEVSNG
jgi:hypothetical protein